LDVDVANVGEPESDADEATSPVAYPALRMYWERSLGLK
jgi:hypothetical protein